MVSLLAGVLVAPGASPAEAAICGGPAEALYGAVGKNSVGEGYPVTLHGTTVRLYTGKDTAGAYARLDRDLWENEILSIDRSRATFSGTALRQKWPLTSQVSASGGWDYCQKYPGGTAATPHVDGYKHAVRPCLRRAGALQCANVWYSDQDR